MHQNQNTHIPVLLNAVLEYLTPRSGEAYLDLTAGYGGHAAAILEQTKQPERAVLVDRDEAAVKALQKQFAASGVEIIHSDFYEVSRKLLEAGQRFDVIVADLGVSSPHLDSANRGFSFASPGPLDMRMDQSQVLNADEIVNTYNEAQLTDIIRRYGEDPKAHRIARNIVADRPIHSTDELARVVARAWPGHHKIHPATRTFQALRIAVNDELSQLEKSLPLWLELLAPNGRIGVISFHSLEDRLVKRAFQERSGQIYDASLRLLSKSPVTADAQELAFNPRARSAKLRVAVKINT